MRAVYATDLSSAIDTAIDSRICLKCLGRYGIDEIDLITVTSPNITAGMPGSDIAGQTKRGLQRQQQQLESEGFTVNTHIVRGTPHRRINGLAEQVHADLIIAGSRGQSPLKQRFIGSTVRNIARTAVSPLLVQRIVERDGAPEVANKHLFRRMLYATDFSENAERAFEQFHRTREATHEATLLHVRPPDRRAGDDGVDDAEQRLKSMAETLQENGIETTTMVREGEAAEEILAVEDEVDPTTVLLGGRGRSRLRRLLLGSTSEDVTARADSNVLLVPPAR
ncbi:universal stress protein [Halapricum desulfuricans]|uniref:Nucleotide-binding protein, UspA family n=1 Tax=Halapricum desulfuricans TaxID=2841257 RepID=A0A897NSR9_9EURY|nr:universal stress protein [Halapricum desulfuricans]QSG14535.1 Nucleotide-binding protein, UspA family [Halapricum desulfuricans]